MFQPRKRWKSSARLDRAEVFTSVVLSLQNALTFIKPKALFATVSYTAESHTYQQDIVEHPNSIVDHALHFSCSRVPELHIGSDVSNKRARAKREEGEMVEGLEEGFDLFRTPLTTTDDS